MLGLRIKDILEQAGVPFKQTKRSIVCNCPTADCQSEFKTYIEKENGRSICFKCNARWNAVGIVSALLQLSRVEAENILFGGRAAEAVEADQLVLDLMIDDVSAVDADFIEEEDIPLREIPLDPLFLHAEKSQIAMEYLEGRGLTDLDKIRSHGILYSAVMNAVVFVVKDLEGRIVGWQARFITPWNPKLRMLTYEGMPKAKILYNSEKAFTSENLILTEGPFDCLKCDLPQYGAVASFGKIVSDQQINMILKSSPKNVYIGLDKDAYQEVQKLAEKIGKAKRVFRILPPEHRKDFGECTSDEIIESIAAAEECFPEKTSRVEVYLK